LLVRAGIPEEIVYDKWPRVTILVPLDGSELAESVLPYVEALAKQRGAERVDVVLLRVCEPVIIAGDEYSASPLVWRDYMEQEPIRRKQECEQYLIGVEKRLKDAGLTVCSMVLLGRPADQIIDYAKGSPFNLIAMATHGRSGLSRWAYGSVAEKVLLGVSSPVFLVRPQ